MNKKAILFVLILFSLGWLGNSIYTIYFGNHYIDVYKNIEKNNVKIAESYKENLEVFECSKICDFRHKENLDLIKFGELESLYNNEDEPKDKPSPHNWISQEEIFVYEDEVVIKVKSPEWAIFTDTKSMDPAIDSTSKAIEIMPKSTADIHIGDIVAYKSKYKNGVITHRVVGIGNDTNGWYAKLKGDNNNDLDPEKVRFEQIKRIVVAIIY